MMPEEVLAIPAGEVSFADILLAFEAWLTGRVARAVNVTRFEHGGRKPRLVMDPSNGCPCNICTWTVK